jgi:hypothetical protein
MLVSGREVHCETIAHYLLAEQTNLILFSLVHCTFRNSAGFERFNACVDSKILSDLLLLCVLYNSAFFFNLSL